VENVNIYALPIATISANGNTTFCQGGSVDLVSSSSTGNIWNTSTTSQQITVTTSGDYFVTITDGNNCSGISNTITVVVNPLPDVTITSDQTSITVTNVNASYQWVDCASGLQILNETNQTYFPNNSGDYACILTENACSDTSICSNIIVSHADLNEIGIPIFRIFPNPANDIIHFSEVLHNLVITNIMGQEVYKSEQSINQLNVKDFVNGIYFIRATNNTTKFEVKHDY